MKQNIPFNADPMGAAIYDYYKTGSADALVVHSSMFEDDEIPVDALFRDFDYVALGHIHKPQRLLRDTVRYAGSPLKYSFSEETHHKSVTVVELEAKGDLHLRLIPLIPRHDLRSIRGTFAELTDKSYWPYPTYADILFY